MKRVLVIGAAVVLVVVVVVVVVLLNAGSIIKTVVEKVGSDATQARVTLDDVELSVTSGQGTLRGLTVGNPTGFTSSRAMRLGEIGVTLDVSTVNSDPIVVKEIVVGAPEVTYEFGPGGSNLDALRKNVEAYGAGSGGGAPAAGAEAGGRRLVIENLYIRDGRIDVHAPLLRERVGTALPVIHLQDIGKGGGASTAEVAERILVAISRAARGAVGKLDVAEVRNALERGLGGAERTLQEGAGSAEQAVKGGVEKTGERVKKLLGR